MKRPQLEQAGTETVPSPISLAPAPVPCSAPDLSPSSTFILLTIWARKKRNRISLDAAFRRRKNQCLESHGGRGGETLQISRLLYKGGIWSPLLVLFLKANWIWLYVSTLWREVCRRSIQLSNNVTVNCTLSALFVTNKTFWRFRESVIYPQN